MRIMKKLIVVFDDATGATELHGPVYDTNQHKSWF